MVHRTRWRGEPTWPGAVGLCAWLLAAGCGTGAEPGRSGGPDAAALDAGGAAAADAGTVEDSAAADAGPCAPGHDLPGGGCCEPQTFATTGGACVEAGPLGCPGAASPAGAGPEADGASSPCAPSWCRLGSACELDDAGCFKGLRACLPDDPGGCAPGMWPSPLLGGKCVPAGGAAPDVANAGPRWCMSGQTATVCTGEEADAGCPPGEWPDGGACRPAGPDWDCPPGFLEGPVEGSLPTCLPDPADCLPWEETTGALHVDGGAPGAGADGSFAHPFPTVQKAVAAAPSGGVVFVRGGTYVVAAAPPHPVTIRGTCAAEVTFVHDAINPFLVIKPAAVTGTVRLERVEAVATTQGFYVQSPNLALALDHVWLTGTTKAGLVAVGQGGSVSVRDSVVVGTDPKEPGTAVVGVVIGSGVQATLERVRMTGAVLALTPSASQGQALASVDGLVVADAAAGMLLANLPAASILAQGQSVLSGSGVRVVGSGGIGVASVSGATMTLRDAAVVGTRLAPDGSLGVGLWVNDADLGLVGARVQGSAGMGALVIYESRFDATGLLVEDTGEGGTGLAGPGLVLADLASASVRASRFHGNRAAGVVASGPGARLWAGAVLVDGTLPGDPHEPVADGRGMEVSYGAAADLWGVSFEGNAGVGTLVTLGGVFRGMGLSWAGATDGGMAARGLEVVGLDSDATVVGSVARGFSESALRVAGGASLVLVGSEVEGAGPSGEALTIAGPSSVDAEATVLVGGARPLRVGGGFVTARHVAIAGARAADDLSGDGVLVETGAALTLQRSSVSGSDRAGVLARPGSAVGLDAVVLTGNGAGLVAHDDALVDAGGLVAYDNGALPRGEGEPQVPPLVDARTLSLAHQQEDLDRR